MNEIASVKNVEIGFVHSDGIGGIEELPANDSEDFFYDSVTSVFDTAAPSFDAVKELLHAKLTLDKALDSVCKYTPGVAMDDSLKRKWANACDAETISTIQDVLSSALTVTDYIESLHSLCFPLSTSDSVVQYVEGF